MIRPVRQRRVKVFWLDRAVDGVCLFTYIDQRGPLIKMAFEQRLERDDRPSHAVF